MPLTSCWMILEQSVRRSSPGRGRTCVCMQTLVSRGRVLNRKTPRGVGSTRGPGRPLACHHPDAPSRQEHSGHLEGPRAPGSAPLFTAAPRHAGQGHWEVTVDPEPEPGGVGAADAQASGMGRGLSQKVLPLSERVPSRGFRVVSPSPVGAGASLGPVRPRSIQRAERDPVSWRTCARLFTFWWTAAPPVSPVREAVPAPIPHTGGSCGSVGPGVLGGADPSQRDEGAPSRHEDPPCPVPAPLRAHAPTCTSPYMVGSGSPARTPGTRSAQRMARSQRHTPSSQNLLEGGCRSAQAGVGRPAAASATLTLPAWGRPRAGRGPAAQ